MRRARLAFPAGMLIVAVTLSTAFAACAGQRRDRESDASQDETAIAFVLGNVEYLLVHEIAHFLIAEKDIPVIGPVENAADYVATLALIREEPLDPARPDRAIESLFAAAEAFVESWRTGTALGADVPYWGAHALSIQRYYQIVCLLYGSNPEAFEDLPVITGLPPTRSESCVAEYTRADRAVGWLLAEYGRQPDDAPGAPTRIVYREPPTVISATVLRELQRIELIERITERLHERFALEQPFGLVMRSCGWPEAAWVPDRRELVICYELLDTLYLLGLQAGDRAADTN